MNSLFSSTALKIRCKSRKILSSLLLLTLCLGAFTVDAKSKIAKDSTGERVVQAAQVAPQQAIIDGDLGGVKSPALRTRNVIIPFRKIGAIGPLGLRGIQGSVSLPFSIRSDEVVLAAKLRINYNYSPSLLPELSHIQVMMNDEVISVIPLPKEKNLNNEYEVNIDSRYFTDYNKLMFRLIGHYTYRCEDPLHSSLWANISHKGSLELTLAPLALVNDLKILPLPFFDRRDDSPLKLPFVFSGKPNFGTLKAAGVTASWFGQLSGYRTAQFPTHIASLPAETAVVFLQGSNVLPGVNLDAINGPTLAIEPHPTNPLAKLLIIAGRNDEELMQAVRALVFNNAALSGRRVSVVKDNEPPARKPYDAPGWVPNDRPVRFGELAKMADMQVRGYFPDVIRLNFRVSPDLFTWRSAGVPMELKYRYTLLPFNNNSSLNVSINNNFIHALPLSDADSNLKKNAQLKDKLRLPVLDNDMAVREDVLFVPPYQVGSRNQLQMHYFFEVVKEGECRDSLPDNLAGAVDPDSTVDFSVFPHYAAMPNLAFFANIGFPFTRYADLAETAVVLPDSPSMDEVSVYLGLMGRMGEATGYPSLRHALVTAGEVDKMADRDILVIGNKQSQSLMTRWADRLPIVDTGGERRLRSPDVMRKLLYRWGDEDLQHVRRPDGTTSLAGAGRIAALMAFESPLRSKRSVVIAYADMDAGFQRITDTLNDPDLVSQVQGDLVILNDSEPEHYKVSDTYFIGNLPMWTGVTWMASRHPLLAGLLVLIAAILIATLVYRVLRKLSEQRLRLKD